MGASNSTTLQITLTTDGEGNTTASIGNVANAIKQIKPASDEAKGGLEGIASSIETIKNLMAAWGVYEVLKEAIGGFLEANASAQKLQATLIAVTGTQQAANNVYKELGEISANTVSTTNQLVDAYTRLQNAGIKPTMDLLTSMANIAVGTGSTVDQVANAMAAAYEGNARGLKQLGITAQEAGDQLILTFQGQKTVIDNSAQGLTDFFNKFGQSTAFVEAQKASVESLGGSWHQFWKQLEDDASSGNGVLGTIVNILTELINQAKNIAKGRDTTSAEYFYNRNQGGITGGAGEGVSEGAPDVSFDKANAATQANIELLKQLAAQTGLVGAADEIYNDTLGRLATALGNVATAQRDQDTSIGDALADMATANANAQKYTTSTLAQAQAMGLTNVQQIQLRISSGDLAAADLVQQANALASAHALDAKTASLKAAAQYQSQLAADQSYIDGLTQQIEMLGQTNDYLIILNATRAASKAANDADRDAILAVSAALYSQKQAEADLAEQKKIDKQDESDNQDEIDRINGIKDALKAVNDELSPADAAWDKYIKQMNTLDDALQTLGPEYDDLITKLKLLAKQQLDTSNANIDGAKQLTQLYEQVGNSLVDALSGGMKDAGKKVLEETQNIIKEVEQAWLKAHITSKINTPGDGIGGTSVQPGDAALAGGAFIASSAGDAVGGKAGGFISGAASGAIAGAEIGGIYGAVIGGLIGGIVGALGAQSTKTPAYQISGGGSFGKGGSDFSDDLGTMGITGQHVNNDMSQQVEQKIEQFDDALAGLLPPDMVDAVKAKIAAINTSFSGSDPSAVEKAHLDAVISAVMPQFQKFIDGISGVDNELKAFQGLTGLQKDLKNTQSTIIQLTGTPLQKLQDQLQTLATNIADAQDTLTSAIKTQDPTQILTAEQALKAAVTARYQAEIQDVQNLLQAEQSLEQSSYSLNLSLAQKIGQLTGDMSGAVDVASQRMADLKDQITNDTDYGDALNKVQELQQATDDWLSAAQAQIESNYNDQIQALEDQKSAIQDQQAAASEASQAASQAADDARQAQIAALQKQLTLAQAWLSVLDDANQMIQDMETGSSNPLGGFSQLDNLNQIIAAQFKKVTSETGTQQATDAQTILANLQQRLQLIQSSNLYDRSSGDYMTAYNQTLAQISQIQGIAGPKASQVDLLQAQIDALNAIKTGVSGGFASNSSALNAINAQEDALKKQEQKQLDDLNKQAADYYKWEQGEAQDLEAKRHQEIMDQLNAITGGVDPTQYIAEESTAMAASLNSIDQKITDFLNSIGGNTTTSVAGANPGGTAAGSGGGGGGGAGAGAGAANHANSNVAGGDTYYITSNVSAPGNSASDIAEAVTNHISQNIGAITTQVKRRLKAA